jgi:putative PIN family toxin of toxin-antitoxin system
MKVVLDTNVLVAGLRSRQGASFRILTELPERRFTPVISVPLMLEYEAVLKRPEHSSRITLGGNDVDAILDMVAAVSDHVRLFYLWRPLSRDPADDMVIETAVAGSASGIVTFNRRDFEGAVSRFGLKLMTPGEFLIALKEEGP